MQVGIFKPSSAEYFGSIEPISHCTLVWAESWVVSFRAFLEESAESEQVGMLEVDFPLSPASLTGTSHSVLLEIEGWDGALLLSVAVGLSGTTTNGSVMRLSP